MTSTIYNQRVDSLQHIHIQKDRQQLAVCFVQHLRSIITAMASNYDNREEDNVEEDEVDDTVGSR